MPFENEHSCRLKSPDYPKYRRQNCAVRHNDKCIDYIFGIKSPNKSELQAMRYNKKVWTASAAKAHCSDKGGSFEAARAAEDGTMKSLFVRKGEEYEEIRLTLEDCVKWFSEHSDEEGTVTEDVRIYEYFEVKVNTDGIGWVLSDQTLDRDMEKFDSSGWDLKWYKKNPVVLWGHDQERPAIGKMANLRVKDTQLKGQVVFSSKEIDPFAAMIEAKVREGTLSAGSVGFKPLKIELIEDEKDPCRLIYRKQELREFSICNVPANPNALAEPKEDEPGEEKDYEEDIEEMKRDIENLKVMQIELAEKVAKDDRNYLEDLFQGKDRKDSGLKPFFGEQ